MNLILFDIDGTLLHTHGIGMRALDEAFREILGTPLASFPRSFTGMTDQLILEDILGHIGHSADAIPTLIPGVFERYLSFLGHFLAEGNHLEVLPGVRRLLDALQGCDGVALALGTGNIEGAARMKLQSVQLDHYFGVGGFGSDARTRAEVLRAGVAKAERHFGTRFSTVWVVGDTPADVQAGRDIGARVMAVASGFASKGSLASEVPDVLVDTLENTDELVSLLVG